MKVVDSKYKDLPEIAHCHRQCFPQSLSSAMGPTYCKAMISWYLDVEKAFLFHVVADGKCVGYCGGIINDGSLETGSASGMMQHSMGAAIKAFLQRPWLLFHHELRKKYPLFLRNLWSKLGVKKNATATAIRQQKKHEPVAGLVVIGVLPEYRGKGVSGLLLQGFEERASKRGIHKLGLSVLASNSRAIGAYEKNGWAIIREEETGVKMVKNI